MEEDSDQNLPKESYLFTPEEINKLNLENLSTLQQMQFKVFLNQYVDVFASENEFGRTAIVKHQIDMGDDFTKWFIVTTDALKNALEAVLSQIRLDNREHPVAYTSCSTSPAEKN
ncbi:hypothetical protein G9A89_018006 [Geosiphon pyriformis]|nr:hypothetical protein G9A89_018006 [Geosiphon pyriformis]